MPLSVNYNCIVHAYVHMLELYMMDPSLFAKVSYARLLTATKMYQ